MSNRLILLFAWIAALVLSGMAPAALAATASETPAAPTASAILPPQMLSGPNFSVDPTVATDGYLYVYALHTRYGDLRVASTALLATRIAETTALAAMEQVSSLQEFGGGIVAKGKSTIEGAADLVRNPLGTLSGAVTGVGRMFENLQQDLASGNIGNGAAAAKILGVPALERHYAAQFGVDPYTTNPLVRKRLHDMATAGAAGNITATALAALIPGGAGIAVSAAGATATLNNVDLTAPPEALARQNLTRLAGMRVPPETAALFIGDQTFTPSQQSRVVASLAAMPAVQNTRAFVSFLADTNDPDVARFRERMAAMYAGYNANVSPLTDFVAIGRHVAAVNAAGKLILVFPADCFFWTETNAVIAQAFNEFARSFPANGIEIWIAGKASPLFAKKIRSMGWKFHDRSASRLLGQPY